jgi:hypothetical protein
VENTNCQNFGEGNDHASFGPAFHPLWSGVEWSGIWGRDPGKVQIGSCLLSGESSFHGLVLR